MVISTAGAFWFAGTFDSVRDFNCYPFDIRTMKRFTIIVLVIVVALSVLYGIIGFLSGGSGIPDEEGAEAIEMTEPGN